MFLRPVFTPVWMTPQGDDIQNPVHDALEKTKTYLSGICDAVEFGGTKQKILNSVFSTLADAYIDRFIIAVDNDLKLKLFE